MNIALGADPEIFVENKDGNMPAFDFLPSKYEPLKTVEESMNYYWDGFQAEFNIVPSSDLNKCLTSIRYGLRAIQNKAKEKDNTARLSPKTVIEVSTDMLASLDPEFVDFGCMPSYNVYNIKGMINDGQSVPYRFAGGHIHFGIGQHPIETLERAVQALDSILGVACVSLFENLDNPVRRHYYGLAGEYRTPPHGLEYRVLSAAWLFHPYAAHTMLGMSRAIVDRALAGPIEWVADKAETVETILTANAEMAREILDRNKASFASFNCDLDCMKPIEHSIASITNIAENWEI